LQVVASHNIAKGDEILLDYGPKDNGTFLYAYGFLADSMVFGNPFHKVRATAIPLTFR
jgi:hypothetical protein